MVEKVNVPSKLLLRGSPSENFFSSRYKNLKVKTIPVKVDVQVSLEHKCSATLLQKELSMKFNLKFVALSDKVAFKNLIQQRNSLPLYGLPKCTKNVLVEAKHKDFLQTSLSKSLSKRSIAIVTKRFSDL